ncbi:signal peptidase I [Candidatus Dependentiae bacterium]|nr:MAG: signal peptidase I [Candidatus Dependentiae bacterium]
MIRRRIAAIVNGFFSDSVREIIGLLLIIFLIRTFGFGLYQVPTGSMETTMLVGERFFADKLTILFTRPKHGNIISFNDPTYAYSDNLIVKLWQHYVWGPSNWTKRVIGSPGDIVKGVIENNIPVVYLNGKKLDEAYINKYPLIGIWKVDPLKLHALLRNEVIQLIGNSTNQALLEKVASQTMGKYYDLRSYDSSVPYNKQPFYRMSIASLVKTNVYGEPVLGQNGNPLLCYPYTPSYQRQNKITRRGNNYWSGSDEFYVELGANEYWLMGDNRRGSYDSRFFGPVKGSLIHGKILYRIWSVDSTESWWIVDIIRHPTDFWKRVRWNRFFQRVK